LAPEAVGDVEEDQQRGRDHDRVEALAALLRPVDVGQVQPERELVED